MVALRSLALLLVLAGTTHAGENVLMQFTADWCGPCQAVKPTVARLKAAGAPVRVVNIDRNRALAAQYRVTSIPCFVMLVDGQEVDRVVGPASAARLQQMLAKIPAARPANPAFKTRAQSPDQPNPHQNIPFPQHAPPAANFQTQPNTPAQQRLLQATVRLKVEDSAGHSFGTGTLIDFNGEQALVLTCGHIFRDSAGQGKITVDLVGLRGDPSCAGQLLSYDLKRDIGLVVIRPTVPVVVAPVASPGTKLAMSDRVSNVGCNNGQQPTLLTSRVTGIDKYLGPPNVEVAGMPVEGRSGGGLFNDAGQVVGVCFAADPQDNEGVYAGLASIHAELDRLGLAEVYQTAQAENHPRDAQVAVTPPPMPRKMPRYGDEQPIQTADYWTPVAGDAASGATRVASAAFQQPASSPASKKTAAPLTPQEQAALEEIRARGQNAEVICIIRPLSDPDGKSEIIVLDRASPAFLQQLSGKKMPDRDRQLTSHDVPRAASRPARQPYFAPRTSQDDDRYDWRPKQ